jgi:hypothetical protein
MGSNKEKEEFTYEEAVNKFFSLDRLKKLDKDRKNAEEVEERALNSLQEFAKKLKSA